jgi:hypothetical protein
LSSARCPHCGKALSAFRRFTSGDGFCSDVCRTAYHGELSRMALSRLIDIKNSTPAPPLRSSRIETRSAAAEPATPLPPPPMLPPRPPAGYMGGLFQPAQAALIRDTTAPEPYLLETVLPRGPYLAVVEASDRSVPEPVNVPTVAGQPMAAPEAHFEDAAGAPDEPAAGQPPAVEREAEPAAFEPRVPCDQSVPQGDDEEAAASPIVSNVPGPMPVSVSEPLAPEPEPELVPQPALPTPIDMADGDQADGELESIVIEDAPAPPPEPSESLAAVPQIEEAPLDAAAEPPQVRLAPAVPFERTSIPVRRPLSPRILGIPPRGSVDWKRILQLSTTPLNRPSEVDPFEAALEAGVFRLGLSPALANILASPAPALARPAPANEVPASPGLVQPAVADPGPGAHPAVPVVEAAPPPPQVAPTPPLAAALPWDVKESLDSTLPELVLEIVPGEVALAPLILPQVPLSLMRPRLHRVRVPRRESGPASGPGGTPGTGAAPLPPQRSRRIAYRVASPGGRYSAAPGDSPATAPDSVSQPLPLPQSNTGQEDIAPAAIAVAVPPVNGVAGSHPPGRALDGEIPEPSDALEANPAEPGSELPRRGKLMRSLGGWMKIGNTLLLIALGCAAGGPGSGWQAPADAWRLPPAAHRTSVSQKGQVALNASIVTVQPAPRGNRRA